MKSAEYNVAFSVNQWILKLPQKEALVLGKNCGGQYQYSGLTFFELGERIDRYAQQLLAEGLKPGMKTLVFLKPGLEFAPLTFALFKIGVIPVFIDPGMGVKNLLSAIKEVRPEGLIAEPIVHAIAKIFKGTFSSIQFYFIRKKVPFIFSNIPVLGRPKKNLQEKVTMLPVAKEQMAAILFTSGGTGVPKGVVYTHGIFNAQIKMLKEMFALTDQDIDIPGFPLFSLFTLAMGMKSCPPDMNPARPAQANPRKLVQNILDQKATFVAGSPAIWEKVAQFCVAHNITLPTVKYLVMFGAPVRPEIHQMFSQVLTNGTTYTPYGATECLPVSCIRGDTLLQDFLPYMKEGKGTCVGLPTPGQRVAIIPINDGIIPEFDLETGALPPYQIGEVVVQGPTVTPQYYKRDKQTALAKMHDKDGHIWHRMGDLGYLDEQGRLWFAGRKNHRVVTQKGLLSPIQCEAIFNRHPAVKRTALIGLGPYGQQRPGLIIEWKKMGMITHHKQDLLELKQMANDFPHTQEIDFFMGYRKFPVDIRHNIKIDRNALRNWAAKRVQ